MTDKFDTVYICDWLPPDFGAVGQYSLILARELAAEGRGVVLAGLSTYGLTETQTFSGKGRLKVITFFASSYNKNRFATRLLWTISVNTKLVFGLWRTLWSCKEIRFTGSPPLLLHWIAPLNLLLRKRLVYRITDFHPECLMAARNRRSWWLKLVYSLTLYWRRRIDQFEVLGEDQKVRLLDIGIAEERIRMKPNSSPVQIKETTKPVTVDFEYTGTAKDPMGNTRVGFEGKAVINRKEWGVEWNAPMETGGVLVSEKITLEIEVSAIKREQAD